VRRTPLAPRPGLASKVAAVFRELVTSVAPGHFQACDLPLLEELACAIHVAREAREALSGAELGTPKGNALARLLREQGKAIAMLATRARLTPQSRMSREKAGSAASGHGTAGIDWSTYLEEKNGA